MKRTFGAFMLLAGLTGCVTFGNNAYNDKKVPEPKAVSGLTPTGVAPAEDPGSLPPPAYSAWSAHPGHLTNGGEGVARGPISVPTTLQSSTVLPDLKPLPPPAPAKPPEMPAGMPVATTPKAEAAEPKTEVKQASATGTSAPKLPEIINGAKGETPRPAPSPAPVARKDDEGGNPTTSKLGGAPLLRLVNTKRITLNFEIADVGSSGVSAVDLWYTQDGREWKKHEAPTNAKAYVVEVDDEGMYGFTLVARSGIGLGKEPPAAGDQPQVWVIVDLTKPDLQLTEVTPLSKGKMQEVSIKWSASDKNLGRGPVTLSYAESEEGPWHVIAGNLKSNGQHTWQVPSGIPPRVFVRAEAADLAGNVGRAQSNKPIVMDASMPKVSIVNVEASAGR
jgi:hypothetical protein